MTRRMDGLDDAVRTARRWARHLGRGPVRSEHLLLAVAETSDGTAGDALGDLGITPDNVLLSIIERASREGEGATGRIEDGLDGCARDALVLARNEAGRRDADPDDLDLLVGLARGKGLASDALGDLGIGPADLRAVTDRPGSKASREIREGRDGQEEADASDRFEEALTSIERRLRSLQRAISGDV